MKSNKLPSFACVFAIFLCALASSTSRGAEATTKPNIVFVISDDQRWDCLGAAGNPNIHTPAQDRLAKEGTHFRQATIHVPQCSPSRATLLTGLAPHQHGWFSNQAAQSNRTDSARLQSLPMLPRLLRNAGYQTIFIGKWHLDPEPWDCGFTEVRTWLPGGGGPYQDAGLAHGNSRKHPVVKGYTNQIFGDDAASFIDSDQARAKPFFLWLALTAPHMPIKPNPPDIEKNYAGKSKQDLMPPNFPKDRDVGDWQHYYEACTMADRQLEHVVAALEKQGLFDNTMILYLGDNGFMMGGRDMPLFKKNKPYMGKVFPYEDSVRVPMIVKLPGGKSATGASDAPVSSLDLPPTILKAAGVNVPATWPGRDLTALMRGEADRAQTIAEAFCEFADNESDKFGDIAYRLVRTPAHKLIVWESKDRADELYDLKNDPRETKNIVNDPATKAVKEDLRNRLDEWMKKTDDPARNWKKSSEAKAS